MAQPPKAGAGRRWWRRLLLWSAVALLLCLSAGLGAGLGAWFYISRDLPRIERLADYAPPAVTQVLAADGRLMAEYYRQRRYVIPLDQIPPHVIWAFVSAEDGDFFKHAGIDFWGILRAAVANLRAGRVVQGGSTITQQVARGLLLTPQRTIVRKLKEMVLAWRMEHYLTKREILYLYLNQIYLGHGAYGIQAAAQTYFGKDAKDLDLAEAALLAGLVQAPSRYSPIRHPRRARTRQVYVIQRMLADGHITRAQAKAALEEPMEVHLHRPAKVNAPYYTEAVRQWLEERFGTTLLYQGGLTVHTACDPRLTAHGQEAIHRGLKELSRRHVFRGPLGRVSAEQLQAIRRRPVARSGFRPGQETEAVVTSPDGQGGWWLRLGSARGRLTPQDLEWIRRGHGGRPALKPGDVIRVRLVAYHAPSRSWWLEIPPAAQAALLCLEAHTGKLRVIIGGRDFNQSQYNRALQARRQPGSAFKPFIYAAALDHPVMGLTPSSIIVDAPVVFDDPAHPGRKWKPKNYENRFFGPTTLRNALAHSRNVVTVKLLAQLGIRYTIDYARKFGFSSPLAPNLSLALGSSGLSLLELTRAYSVFANGGRLVDPVMVEKVLDRRGKVIYQARPQVRQVISPQTAFLMTHLLRGVVEHGTGRRMKALGRPVAGKTGTTNDLRDAWFIGFTPRLVCGVWVGRDDNRPLGRRETGARAAGPIWLYFMQKALQDTPPQDFPVPPGVVFAKVDLDTGRPLPPGAEGGFFEAFRQGHEPTPPRPGQHPPPAEGASGFLQAETFAPGQEGDNRPPPQP